MEQVQHEIDAKNRYRIETPGHAGWERTARPDDPDKYLMISADCHANEPGNLWRERIDAKFRARLPHVEVDAKGEKWFIAEGLGKSRVRARMIADVPRQNSEDRLRGTAGADPEQRIRDHRRDGVDGCGEHRRTSIGPGGAPCPQAAQVWPCRAVRRGRAAG